MYDKLGSVDGKDANLITTTKISSPISRSNWRQKITAKDENSETKYISRMTHEVSGRNVTKSKLLILQTFSVFNTALTLSGREDFWILGKVHFECP